MPTLGLTALECSSLWSEPPSLACQAVWEDQGELEGRGVCPQRPGSTHSSCYSLFLWLELTWPEAAQEPEPAVS
jgi:hypothetical protein